MSEKNDWITIWVQPRATIRRIVGENPKRGLWLLAAIYGFSALLNSFQSLSFGSSLGILPIFILALLFAPIWGYLVFAIWGYVVSLTGRWLKGQGDFQQVRAAYAWSCVPLVVGDLIWILMMFFIGASLFINPSPEQILPSGKAVLLLSLLFCKVVLSIWSLVIYLNALAEVQKFSVFRAIGNVIIAGIIVGIVVGIIWGVCMYILGVPTQSMASPGTAFQLLQESKAVVQFPITL